MKLYDSNGYLNMEYIYNIDVPFIFICGGRGIGKTYGGIKYMDDNNIPFILMRRTQVQADLIAKPEFSPLKPVLSARGLDFKVTPITKQCTGVYRMQGENIIDTMPWCYTAALSTFSNMRGFSGDTVACTIYDEFIPEKHERPIKNEGAAFLNFYETVNRNRELQGMPPMKVLAFANAFDMTNELFTTLGIVDLADKMAQNVSREIFIDKNRGFALIMPRRSEISSKKNNTAVYRLAGQEHEFTKMALCNDFIYEDRGRIKSEPIAEYRPIVFVGELAIYKHKHGDRYYATFHKTGSAPSFTSKTDDVLRFKRTYHWIWNCYMTDSIIFEKFSAQTYFKKLFD